MNEEAAEAPPVTCYRHPDRETGRRCTRCGRPACPDCLTEASVGSHCAECVKAAAPSGRQRLAQAARGENLIATKSIIGVTVVAFVLMGLQAGRFNGSGRTANNFVLYGPLVHHGEWWRVFTVSLVHVSFFHIFFNMLLLYIIGQLLEPGAGPLRFTLLYVASVAAGSAAVLIATPHAVTAGASGGVFGIAAAATLVMQRQGMRFWDTGFGPLIVINLVFDFFTPEISIAAHIGGAIGGLLAAEAMLLSRKAGRPELGIVGAVLVGAVSFAICLVVAKPI
jgi:membrane associated rhomboid family serine protease